MSKIGSPSLDTAANYCLYFLKPRLSMCERVKTGHAMGFRENNDGGSKRAYK